MKLIPGFGALFRKLVIRFHSYPLNMSFLYRELHTRQFMAKAVSDGAIFFSDYRDYALYNANLFDKFVISERIDKARAICLEFGVSTGATANLLSSALPDYRFVGFDSFEGFVSVKENSIWASFQKRFKGQAIPALRENIELVKGYVENTFPDFARSSLGEVDAMFVHLDMDIYEPTKVVLDWISRSRGTAFVMFDELINYNEFHLHEYRAFLETIVDSKIPYRILSMCDRGVDDYGQFGKVFIEIGQRDAHGHRATSVSG